MGATIGKEKNTEKSPTAKTFSDMVELVREANEYSKRIYNKKEETLLFELDPTKKSELPTIDRFWKNFTRVKIIREKSGNKPKIKIINIKQFYRVLETIRNYSAVDIGDDGESGLVVGDLDELPDECCVCMEKSSDIYLPCTHAFCNECLEAWKKSRKDATCPLCRSPLENVEEEAWVLTQKPSVEDVQDYLSQFMDRV